ncbi:MAG TPA: transglutaminase family protein [Burkholderiales bacterium]|nr:transglutaminase family protein [Burkholderiales bacterium]
MIRVRIDNELHYSVQQPSDFVFNIEVAKNQYQTIIEESLSFDPPLPFEQFTDPLLENRFLRIRANPGTLKVTYRATVALDYVVNDPAVIRESPIAELPMETIPFIFPSRYCQSDLLMRMAQREFGSLAPGYSRVEAICGWIREHIQYQIGSSNPNTSAADVLVQRAGVCRDFAHLAIAFCRALNIPARFIASYSNFPDPPPDFHAVFEAFLGGRWYLFDPTALAPRNQVTRIGTGRDATDVAFATIFGTAQMTQMSPKVKVLEQNVEDVAVAIATS